MTEVEQAPPEHAAGPFAPPARPASVGRTVAPTALPASVANSLPETLRYRLKNKLLGPPLATDRQSTERLGRPTALAVLSSDVISSSAYATEQILYVLTPAVGLAAFSLVVPITVAVIAVLVFVTLSYLEVVKVYTKAGGAYVVARENFGLTVAQVAAVSLLIDYTLTVAVSVAAGVAALTSVVPRLVPETTEIAIAVVVLIAYMNLRGIREAGRAFALPTYFFIANMVALMGWGTLQAIRGGLHAHSVLGHSGAVSVGHAGQGVLLGASVFIVMKAFASGGSALTGTEAISNGVSIFRRPESRNARITMVWMSVILGSLVLGVGALSAVTHPIPYTGGSPTVVSQVATFVYGSSGLGKAFRDVLQGSTMLILVLAANTSFTGFPYLASFAAEDSYLPHALMRRGHRLVYSTGILVLTGVSIVLLAATKAQVNNLIPLYAIGVFTGFTMAGAGMAKHHLRHRESGWRRRLAINGSAGVLSFIVDIIIAVAKFKEGAWVVVILLPVGVLSLLLLHRQYATEEIELAQDAPEACEVPVLRRHAVIVLVDKLDLATARAVQYARTLTPDLLQVVHFAVDKRAADELRHAWGRLGLSRLPLDVVDCPDRRLERAAMELAAETIADGQTELTILLPRRAYASGWKRLLHDRSADGIAEAVGLLPHTNATIVPFQLTKRKSRTVQRLRQRAGIPVRSPDVPKVRPRGPRPGPQDAALGRRSVGAVPIGEATWRQRVKVAGKVKSVRVPTRGGAANLETVLADGTGSLLLVFQGRRQIPGVMEGARMVAEGMVGAWHGQLAILNPDYELIAGPDS